MLVSAPEGGEIIVPKHVAAMQKIVRIEYRTVHFLVIYLFHKARNKHCKSI